MVLASTMVAAVRRHMKDKDALAAISAEFAALAGQKERLLDPSGLPK